MSESTPASPAPLQRSRTYLTRQQAPRGCSRLQPAAVLTSSHLQAELQTEAVTKQALNKLYQEVAAGEIAVPTWGLRNGRLVRTPSKKRDDVQNLSSTAAQRLKRALPGNDDDL